MARNLKKKKKNSNVSKAVQLRVKNGTFYSNLPRGADGKLLHGGGRKPGTPNKVGRESKINITEVFDLLGGAVGMAKWARSSKERLDMFYHDIYPRLLPVQVNAETTNDRYRDVTSEREALGRLLLGAISARNKPEPERVPLLINVDPVRDTEPRLVVPVERASKAA
jgi:hypothetical protein